MGIYMHMFLFRGVSNLYRQCSSYSILKSVTKKYVDENGRIIAPKYFNFARDIVDEWAKLEERGERKPTYPAFWWIPSNGPEDVRWNFKDISELSKKAANVLAKVGKQTHKDKIIVILPKIPEYWLVKLAATRIGSLFSPGSVQLSLEDIEYRIKKLEATCIVTDAESSFKIDTILDRCPSLRTKIMVGSSDSTAHPSWLNFNEHFSSASSEHECVQSKNDDTFCVYFTSGTTGSPKLVEHTHSSLGLGLLNDVIHYFEATEEDLFWCISDPAWAKGAYSSFYSPWLAGAGVFIHEMPVFDPKTIVEVLQNYPITIFGSIPTCYKRILDEVKLKLKFSDTLRLCFSGPETVSETLIEKWEKRTGIKIRTIYGQTEGLSTINMRSEMVFKAGSIGKPMPGIDVLLLNDLKQEINEPFVEGEIAIKIRPHRPLNLFKCYRGDPLKNASVFKGGYYLTGDRAYRDKDGYYWFKDRVEDLILYGGYLISPMEVEKALEEHPAVLESAVVPSPDPLQGDVVKAIVVIKNEFKNVDKSKLTRELLVHVKKVREPYKCPRKVEFVEILPKTPSGKISHAILREKEWKSPN